MKLLLATIEHSGTHNTMTILDKYVGATELSKESINPDPKPFLLYAHLTDDRMEMIREAATRMPVLTTYRDPAQIRASWKRRGKDPVKLEEQLRNYEVLLTFRPKPAVLTLWGGWDRLPPQSQWYAYPEWTAEEVDDYIKRHGHRM